MVSRRRTGSQFRIRVIPMDHPQTKGHEPMRPDPAEAVRPLLSAAQWMESCITCTTHTPCSACASVARHEEPIGQHLVRNARCVVQQRSPSYEPDSPAQHIRRGNSEHRDDLQVEHFLGSNRDRIARLAWYCAHMPPAAAFQAQSSRCQLRACIPCVLRNEHAACGLSSPHRSAGRGRSALESRVRALLDVRLPSECASFDGYF
jgi:hypothetical protein